MKSSIVTGAVSLIGLAAGAAGFPEISPESVTMTQNSGTREVTISYELANGPAIVTVDVFTNCTADAFGASIGGGNLWTVSGDVNRMVGKGDDFATPHAYTIKWNPDRELWGRASISDTSVKAPKLAGGVRAVVTAWSTQRPPDYMVLDLVPGGATRYYAVESAVPNGIQDVDYKTTKLVLRYIPASSRKTSWLFSALQLPVKLTKDYYIGVYPVTQKQYSIVNYPTSPFTSVWPAQFSDLVKYPDRDIRPAEKLSYQNIRDVSATTTAADDPDEPSSTSWLGKLNGNYGTEIPSGWVADLPTEAQWEFACCAGRFGQPINVDMKTMGDVAWYNANSTTNVYDANKQVVGTEAQTHAVGGKLPNAFGLYDMHGNVFEYVLDWHVGDLESYLRNNGFGPDADGAYVDPFVFGATGLAAANVDGSSRKQRGDRGGHFSSGEEQCRATNRSSTYCQNSYSGQLGMRIVLRPKTVE